MRCVPGTGASLTGVGIWRRSRRIPLPGGESGLPFRELSQDTYPCQQGRQGSVDDVEEQRQVFDIPEVHIEVLAHQSRVNVCPYYGTVNIGEFPFMVGSGKICVGVFLAMLLCNVCVFAADALPPKRVLVLYSYEQDRPANLLFDHHLRATFQARTTEPLEFYLEYLDVTRFPEEQDRQQLLNFYRQKYATRKMDVIITVNVPALDFILQHGEELFPGVPIVFSGVAQNYIQTLTLPAHVTGAMSDLNLAQTLNTALTLQPDTRHVAVIAGTSELDQFHAALTQKAFQQYADQLEFTYLSNFTFDELLKQAAELPPKTIIFYLAASEDRTGSTFIPQEVVSEIAQVANVPVYSFSDTYFGHGIVGGDLVSFEAMGTTAAEIGLRILRGEQPANIPITETEANLLLFDWRQLHRWGLREQDLPPGSIVRYKEFSIWEKHKREIVAVITLCFAEAGLIALLLILRSRRKQAETALRASEERYHSLFENSLDGIMLITPDGSILAANPAACKMLGRTEQELQQLGRKYLVDQQDTRLAGFLEERRRTGKARGELTHLRKDGSGFPTEVSSAIFETTEGLQRTSLIIRDITARKQAEESLRLHSIVISNMTEGVQVTRSNDWTIMYVNPRFESMFGYDHGELEGKPVHILNAPDQKTPEDTAAEIIKSLNEKGIWRGEIRNLKKDGTSFWSRVSVSTLEHPQHGTIWVSVHEDITEQKQAAETLRMSDQQYRLLIEHVTDGIGIIQDQQMVFVNEALAAMLGYTVKQLLGKAPVELSRGAYKPYFDHMVQQPENWKTEPHWHILEFVVAHDNLEIWMEGRYSDILWEGKSAVLVTMRDVTERKRREDELNKERERLRQENLRLRTAMKERCQFGDIIGKSLPMQHVYDLILKAAASDANVVIYGESGTGKDLIARTIHQISERREKMFVPVNCGSIPEALFEREFFGHRKGAFTGALSDKPGFFDAAHQGALFLDEIGELTPAMQVKLLRAIEGGGYTPIGDQQVKHADIRIIAATNKNLKELVQQGSMREDFFYRLNVIPITVPPLRERREDIPLLIEHFLKQYGHQEIPITLSGNELVLLYNYAWPGNIRQLQNVLQRYLTLKSLDFSDDIYAAGHETPVSEDQGLQTAVEAFEKGYIIRALEQNNGHKGKTSAYLNIDMKTLYRKIKKYQISLPD